MIGARIEVLREAPRRECEREHRDAPVRRRAQEQAAARATPEQFKAQADAYEVFTKSIVESGNFLAGDPFLPTSTAKTVAVRDGRPTTTPGPFEATK